MRICTKFPSILIAFGMAAFAVSSTSRAGDVERWMNLANTVFKCLGQDNELPTGTNAIAEDGTGFLWVGTQSGLARWDGYQFRTFSPNPNIPGSLPDGFITALHTDDLGRLWIGTNSTGLALYDRDNDRFITYPAGAKGLSHVSVTAIVDGDAHTLWIATLGGLDHLDPRTGAIRHVPLNTSASGGPLDHNVLALLRDHNGEIWIGTAAGLVRFDVGTNHFLEVPFPTQGPTSVGALLEDRRGRIWVGTHGQGVYVIEGANAPRIIEENDRTGKHALRSEIVRTLAEVSPDRIWIGTGTLGIVEVDTLTWHTKRIEHDPTLPRSLGEGAVYALYRDRAGLVWAGTDRSLCRHDATQSAVSTLFGSMHRQDGVSATDVASVLETADGHIWLGLGNNGVDVLDPTGGLVASLRPQADQPDRALPATFITALARSANQSVYIGTRQGLYRTNQTAQGVTRVSIPQSPKNGDVSTLLIDDNVLWVGGDGGLRGLELDDTAGSRASFGNSAQLTDQRVSALSRVRSGPLWVGTQNGLNRLDFSATVVDRILPDPTDPAALSAGFISSLLTDDQGRLWVGTLGGGVNVLQSRDAQGRPRFYRIGLSQGLPNSNVNLLLQDSEGTIWASTDNGIAAIDPRSFAVRTLAEPEGVAISTYWLSSGARTAAGELLFGGAGGLTVIRPRALVPWTYRPPLVITSVRLGGRLVPVGRLNEAGSAVPLTIVPEGNSLSVEFAALDLSAPEQNQYAYRLDGFDRGWVGADRHQRLAVYTNLPPGDYALRLRGSNRNGVWGYTRVIPVRVLAAWYQTSAIELLGVVGAIALMFGLIHIRTTVLRRRQRELQLLIDERTASLTQRTHELQQSELQLERIAYFDELTQLPNRREFKVRLDQLLASGPSRSNSFAVLLIDLDRFKQVNDTLGHEAGDQLLREVADRLRQSVPEQGTVARLGGDEFVVLVPGLSEKHDAATAARRLLAAMSKPFTLMGHEFRVTTSIGISTYPQDALDAQTLTKYADMAMYHAKEEGRNNFQFFSERLNANTLERLNLESCLRHALERDEFRLYYQTKRDIRTGKITGMEALLRWQHPDLGTIAPLKFLPIAEETGLTVPIGRWVLTTACLQNMAWQKQGLPQLSIAVNLTERQFLDEHLVQDVASILQATGMPAQLLELEITESLLIRDAAKTLAVLTPLKALGVRIAADDFGTGYSSLATLQQFPLDTIKIDRSFVRDVTGTPENTILADAVVALGKSLSLTVVAQGVETREQADFLRKHACDELQGFYFNRPLPAQQFAELLRAQASEVTYVGTRQGLTQPKLNDTGGGD
jgi:diguanylate cyclase (GGDEF)-like protein